MLRNVFGELCFSCILWFIVVVMYIIVFGLYVRFSCSVVSGGNPRKNSVYVFSVRFVMCPIGLLVLFVERIASLSGSQSVKIYVSQKFLLFIFQYVSIIFPINSSFLPQGPHGRSHCLPLLSLRGRSSFHLHSIYPRCHF